ncbi:hypothetical protein KJ885_03395 [Patescibacteria group bacterium]|nr:hypothetical protein [Patescibacteria group bacterium]
MKAGVDIGSTLTKVAFKTGKGEWMFLSTSNCPLSYIAEELYEHRVTRLNIGGIGQLDESVFGGFEINRLPGDPIVNEIQLQARGTRELLKLGGHDIDHFLLVSIGTGTSYTFVQKDKAKKFPIGNSVGGGFIRGLARGLNIDDADIWNPLENRFADVETLDLLVQDVLPSTKEQPLGKLIIANFGKLDSREKADQRELQKTLVNMAAAVIARDIAIFKIIYGLTEKHKLLYLAARLLKLRGLMDNIVIIGTAVSSCCALREMLSAYCNGFLQTNPIFPPDSAFALAVGSYYMDE